MQMIRFGMVGAANTLVDFGVLNLLLLAFSPAGAASLAGCNAAAFLAANFNSYLLNRQWTFRDRSEVRSTQYLWFLGFSLVGLVINSGMVVVVSGWLTDGGRGALGAINLAKLCATGVSMSWNYLSYRSWVFNKSEGGAPNTAGMGETRSL